MRTAKTKRHIVVNIEGAINAAKRGEDTVLALLDQPDFATAIKDLEDMKKDGWEVVRTDSCDNYDYAGNCLGHKTWEDDENAKS